VVVEAAPPARLLHAFGVDAVDLRPLRGGQGTSWRAGGLVLKPLNMPIEALAWQAQVLGGIADDGFRLARPVFARGGELVVAGWSAWRWIEGEHLPARWADICAAGEQFHRAVAEIPRPGWHRRRSDPFAQADRAAWDPGALGGLASLEPLGQVARRLRPVPGEGQLIHGDLSGNVLFHPGLPPGIIDLSPYWRPPAFATAVVVVDALVWEDADRGMLSLAGDGPGAAQHLLRALIFRVVMDRLCNPQRRTPPPWWPSLLRVADELCTLADSAER
jgi:uncharacterized protein (TIGR02569 family)